MAALSRSEDAAAAASTTAVDQRADIAQLAFQAEASRQDATLAAHKAIDAELVPGHSVIGGGATPQQTLPTWLIALRENAVAADSRLRRGTPPVIGRIQDDRLVLDLRTVFPDEEEDLARTIQG